MLLRWVWMRCVEKTLCACLFCSVRFCFCAGCWVGCMFWSVSLMMTWTRHYYVCEQAALAGARKRILTFTLPPQLHDWRRGHLPFACGLPHVSRGMRSRRLLVSRLLPFSCCLFAICCCSRMLFENKVLVSYYNINSSQHEHHSLIQKLWSITLKYQTK